MKSKSLFAVNFTIFCLLLSASSLFAYPGGVSGYTKKGISPGCTCHTSSPSSSVTLVFAGPSTLNTGETGDYTVLMTYTSTITGGGIDIAASTGTLAKVDSRLKVLNGELTQPSKQTGTTQLLWSFKYTAPSTPGTQTLYATGCAVKSKWNHANNFTVTVTSPQPGSLNLLSPLQGANLTGNSSTNITWTATNVANVKLEFSPDGGVNWTTIAGSTPASAGSYTWTVPATASSTCLVRVSDVLNASVNSLSGVFSISLPVPEYNISHLHLNDANGVSLDTGKVVTIKGIVTVANEFNSPSFLQDSTGGLAVFGRGAGAFSSSIERGDYIKVTGKVVSYNGLTEINPVTDFQKLDSGLVVEPTVVTIGDIIRQNWGSTEPYEGKLLKLTGLSLASQVSTWAGNTNYMVTDGTDSMQIRITNGTDLVGQPAPANAIFDLTSVVSQFKATPPFSDGYQLMPRSGDDLVITTGITNENLAITNYRLEQNYPNPFSAGALSGNPSTTISYVLPCESNVRLQIFNSLGEEVATLIDGSYGTGRHSVRFEASGLVSGIYFYKLVAVPSDGSNGFTELKKLILLK